MCRYSNNQYKNQFICFTCKKGFKKIGFNDYLKQHDLLYKYKIVNKRFVTQQDRIDAESKAGTTVKKMVNEYLGEVNTCPDCGQEMAWMGLDFRVPAKTDTEQWEIVKVLYENNFAFHGCGCGLGYRPPKHTRELATWLDKHERKSEGAKILALFESRA